MSESNASTGSEGISERSRRLWLVRHGLTAWNTQQRFGGHSDLSLTRAGRVQARWLARRLHSEKIIALYCSDLLRARETAEIIASASARPLSIQTSAAWRELDFGAWDGLTYAEIATRFPTQLDFFTDPEHFAPSAGEALPQLRQRVLLALAQAVREQDVDDEGDIVIVSHGGPLRVLLGCVLGIPAERQWQLALAPGSLSALDLLPGRDASAPLGTLAMLNLQRRAPRARTIPTMRSAGKDVL